MGKNEAMFQINQLQKMLASADNIRAIAVQAGLSEKTVHRIKNGETDTTFGTANKIIAAIAKLKKADKAAA